MSQSHHKQQPGIKDIHVWQQHLMYKQLQEIQRQQQLHQTHQGTGQQNSLGQLTGVTKQSIGNQIPAMLHGLPLNRESNFSWSNELAGSNSKPHYASQMLVTGAANTTCMQQSGTPINDSFRAIQSAGFQAQQLDPSLLTNPDSSTRGFLNNPSLFAASDVFGRDQHGLLEECYLQNDISVSEEGVREANFLGNSPVQRLKVGAVSKEFQQINADLECREQTGRSGYAKEKSNYQGKSSSGVANPDTTDEKLLSKVDEHGGWGASFVSGTVNKECFMYGDQLNNNYSSGFPSIQSGSWSALMQEALGASSSDTGAQEDWSCLTFQNAELSSGNHSARLNDNGKQQCNWENNKQQGSSSVTSRPFLSFNDASASPNSCLTPSFDQSLLKSSCEHDDRMPTNSHESLRPSEKIINKQMNLSQLQEHGVSGSIHTVQFNNVFGGVWTGQIHEQSMDGASTANMEVSSQNTPGIGAEQKKVQYCNVDNGLSGRPQSSHGWTMNKQLAINLSDSLDHLVDNRILYPQRNDIDRTLVKDSDHGSSMQKVDGNSASVSFANSTSRLELVKSNLENSKISVEAPNSRNFVNSGSSNSNRENDKVYNRAQTNKRASLDSSTKYGNRNWADHQQQPSLDQQFWNTLSDVVARQSGVPYTNEQKSVARENSSLAGETTYPLVKSRERSSGQPGRKSLSYRRFHYHPMGDLEVNVVPAYCKNYSPYSGDTQSGARSLEGQDLGYSKQLLFHGPVMPEGTLNMRKGHSAALERTEEEAAVMQSTTPSTRHASTTLAAFDTSTTDYSQEQRIHQMSQNMLFNKTHKSRDSASATHSSSDYKAPSVIPEAAPGIAASDLLHNQFSMSQGFAFGLIPPLQGNSFPTHDLPLQSSLRPVSALGSRHIGSDAGDKDQRLPADATLVLLHNTPLAASTLPNANIQQPHQGIEGTGLTWEAKPKSHTFGGHLDYNAYARQTDDSCDRTLADESRWALCAREAGRNSFENSGPQFFSSDNGLSQLINVFSPGNLSQQLTTEQQSLDLQSPPKSGTSQSGRFGFPQELHNAWRNVSTQQKLSGILPPELSQSRSLVSGCRGANCLVQQMDDHSSKKGASAPSEYGACSTNLQCLFGQDTQDSSLHHVPPKEVEYPSTTGFTYKGQEPVAEHDGPCASVPSVVHPHQQDLGKRKCGLGSSLNSPNQQLLISSICSSNHERGTIVQTPQPPNILLQHIQAMKGLNSYLSGETGKKFKGSDAPQKDLGAADRNTYRQNTILRIPVEEEQYKASQLNPAPPAAQVLSFSKASGEKCGHSSLQIGSGEMLPDDLLTTRQHSSQKNSQLVNLRIMPASTGENRSHQSNPEVAFHWLEQNGSGRSGQILTMSDGHTSSECSAQDETKHGIITKESKSKNDISSDYSAKDNSKHGILSKESKSKNDSSLVELRDDDGRGYNLWLGTPSNSPATLYSHCQPPDVMDHSELPIKRKNAALELLPWHKQSSQNFKRLRNTSLAEVDWAMAANRSIDKVEDKAVMTKDGSSKARPHRRLILTTQLMQHIFLPAPTKILNMNACTSYEGLVYFLAKAAMGDACSLISCLGSNSFVCSDSGNVLLKSLNTLARARDSFFLKVMEDFIFRSRKLESDLCRLEKGFSISEVRMECEDLERFSIMNRFAKLHWRSPPHGVDGSSTPNVLRPTFLQRNVTAFSMLPKLPEGLICLTL